MKNHVARRLFRLFHVVVLCLVTLVAMLVMWWVSSRNRAGAIGTRVVDPLSESVAAKPLVQVRQVQADHWPVYVVYSGKTRAWETYTISFELSGRLAALSESLDGSPLDEGDRVEKGQIVARLDDRVLRSRVREAAAHLEQAETELKRARELRASTAVRAITESEFQQRLTDVALAKAQSEIAEKNLEDAVLTAPAKATIVTRHANVGESVNAHQQVLELIENDPLLLVVNVPEAVILRLESRRRSLNSAQQVSKAVAGAELAMAAVIYLEGRDQYSSRWPPVRGTVHHIADRADPVTGLFEVEIRVENSDLLLRPGMVATAWIEVDRIYGYALEDTYFVFRNGQAYLFSVASETLPVQALYWPVGQSTHYRAQRLHAKRYVEQRPLPQSETQSGLWDKQPNIIVPADEFPLQSVVVRGQHRLTSGQLVRVVNEQQQPANTVPVRAVHTHERSAERPQG